MKSLFPEIEQEILDDRRAARREQKQQARTYLKSRDTVWIINHLLEDGPVTEAALMWTAMEEEYITGAAISSSLQTLHDLYALWLIGKLWRKSQGIHFGSGEESFLYGIKRVHKKP